MNLSFALSLLARDGAFKEPSGGVSRGTLFRAMSWNSFNAEYYVVLGCFTKEAGMQSRAKIK